MNSHVALTLLGTPVWIVSPIAQEFIFANNTAKQLSLVVDLPSVRPALLGAVIVVFVDCLKELPATLLLRPLNVETLATSIYQYASRGSFEEGALAALLIVVASSGPVAWLTRFSDVPAGPE